MKLLGWLGLAAVLAAGIVIGVRHFAKKAAERPPVVAAASQERAPQQDRALARQERGPQQEARGQDRAPLELDAARPDLAALERARGEPVGELPRGAAVVELPREQARAPQQAQASLPEATDPSADRARSPEQQQARAPQQAQASLPEAEDLSAEPARAPEQRALPRVELPADFGDANDSPEDLLAEAQLRRAEAERQARGRAPRAMPTPTEIVQMVRADELRARARFDRAQRRARLGQERARADESAPSDGLVQQLRSKS